ncbi:MAG: hypothetical protein GX275_02330 [Clostridiales bacterium]|nr:hypothetical protein [Clostridiales bacterium]
MNKEKLKEILIRENIPNDAYSLEGGFPNEAYCLNIENGKWQVYYSERGQKSNLKEYYSEEEACEELYKRLQIRLG